MIPNWNNLYDRFKDRRYGMLFLFAPLAVFSMLISLISWLRHGIFEQRELPDRYCLSSDERIKARSKLVKHSQPVRLPPPPSAWIEG